MAKKAAVTAVGGSIAGAPPGAIGFDVNHPLTPAQAADFRGKGYAFCVRYLTRDKTPGRPGDLTLAETGIILDAGLALMAVQHVAPAGWAPTAALGAGYGGNAVKNAQAAGLPPGVNLWLDLESVAKGTARQDVIDYCNAWFTQVDGAGYVSGLYVGVNIVISADDLFFNMKTRHYWKSGSNVPDIPHRGYQMIQRIPPNDGAPDAFDTNVTRTDLLGGAVQWLTRPV